MKFLSVQAALFEGMHIAQYTDADPFFLHPVSGWALNKKFKLANEPDTPGKRLSEYPIKQENWLFKVLYSVYLYH